MTADWSANRSPCSCSANNSRCVDATVAVVACVQLPTMRMLMSSNHARGSGRGRVLVSVGVAMAARTIARAMLLACLEPARMERSA
eukprot:1334046-Pyramimonas_sp.AAC.1